MNEVAGEVKWYGVDVIALQEIRWKDDKEIKQKDYTLLYSEGKTIKEKII